jgi:hypothetical protein
MDIETVFRDEWVEAWFAFMCEFAQHTNHYENPTKYLSANRNITQKIIYEYPDFEWDWEHISYNPNVTWNFVLNHRDKKWNYYHISIHPNITLDTIIANNEFFDCYCTKHVARNPNVTIEMLKTHPYFTNSFGDMGYEWDWYWASDNPNITMDDITKNTEIQQNAYNIGKNRNITFDFVVSNSNYDWDYVDIFRNPSICYYGMSKNEVFRLCYATGRDCSTDGEIANAQIEINSIYATMEQINANKECVWNFCYMSSNKHLTLQMIKNNVDKKWDFEELYKNDLPEDRENYVEQQVCRMLLAIIYEEQREYVCKLRIELVFADEYLVKLISRY